MYSKPLPVRLSEESDKRLSEVAAANHMTKAELVRACVDRALAEIEASGQIELKQVVRAVSGKVAKKSSK